MNIKIRVTGIDDIVRKNKQVMKLMEKGDFEEEVGKRVVNRAKYRAPRKSGKLVRGIHVKKTGKNTISVVCDTVNENGVPYPVFLEYGTRYIPIGTPEAPRAIRSSSGKTAFMPYLRWSVVRTNKELGKIFKEIILKPFNKK